MRADVTRLRLPSVLTVEGLPIEGHRRRVLSLGPTHRTRYQGPPGRGGGPRHAPRRTFQRPGPCASSAAARGAPCSQGMASAGSGGTSSRATPRSVNSREAMRARRRQSLPAAPRAGGRVRGGRGRGKQTRRAPTSCGQPRRQTQAHRWPLDRHSLFAHHSVVSLVGVASQAEGVHCHGVMTNPLLQAPAAQRRTKFVTKRTGAPRASLASPPSTTVLASQASL